MDKRTADGLNESSRSEEYLVQKNNLSGCVADIMARVQLAENSSG
jgi:hypothetical protein